MFKNTKVAVATIKDGLADEINMLIKDHSEAVNRIFTDGINVGYGYGKGRFAGYIVGAATALSLTAGVIAIVQIIKSKKSQKEES